MKQGITVILAVLLIHTARAGKPGDEKKARFFLGDGDLAFGIASPKLSLTGGLFNSGVKGFGGIGYPPTFLGPYSPYYGGGGFFGSLGGFQGGIVLKHFKHQHHYGSKFHYFGGSGGYQPYPYPIGGFAPFGHFG